MNNVEKFLLDHVDYVVLTQNWRFGQEYRGVQCEANLGPLPKVSH